MKGVLAIAHADKKFVYHAVHMQLNGVFAEPWAEGEPRESKMVFIGKNLDAKELADSFNDCLCTAETLQLKKDLLRFEVGDQVECRMGPQDDNWARGTVAAIMFRDEFMPQGLVAPYQVELDEPDAHSRGVSCGSRRVWCPMDAEEVIRVAAPGSGLRRRSARLRGTGRGADDHASDEEHEHTHDHDHDHADFRLMCHEGAVPDLSSGAAGAGMATK
mmetsp:Transcript_28785/g.92217  ORF Transcript_28785/g.92217 Transcript_28785/m.92217 type:complete len:217 (-) Transcript_28785:287-937(-)